LGGGLEGKVRSIVLRKGKRAAEKEAKLILGCYMGIISFYWYQLD
jgi:hypothetical protein